MSSRAAGPWWATSASAVNARWYRAISRNWVTAISAGYGLDVYEMVVEGDELVRCYQVGRYGRDDAQPDPAHGHDGE